MHVLRTIEDILGIEPLGLNDSSVEPMTAVFDRAAEAWDYRAVVPGVLRTTKLPLPTTIGEATPKTGADEGRYARPRHDAAYWAAKTEGMDFSAEDRIDTPRFNRILWAGLMGDAVAVSAEPEAGESAPAPREFATPLCRPQQTGARNGTILAPGTQDRSGVD